MEMQKIINLLNNTENEYSKFATKTWYIIDSESKPKLFKPKSGKIFNKFIRIKSL